MKTAKRGQHESTSFYDGRLRYLKFTTFWSFRRPVELFTSRKGSTGQYQDIPYKLIKSTVFKPRPNSGWLSLSFVDVFRHLIYNTKKYGRFPFEQKFWIFTSGDDVTEISRESFQKTWKIVEFPKCEPFNKKFRKIREENQVEQEFRLRNVRKLSIARKVVTAKFWKLRPELFINWRRP